MFQQRDSCTRVSVFIGSVFAAIVTAVVIVFVVTSNKIEAEKIRSQQTQHTSYHLYQNVETTGKHVCTFPFTDDDGETKFECTITKRRPGLWCATDKKNSDKWAYCECRTTREGLHYNGRRNQTYTGQSCQRWDRQYPHSHPFNSPKSFHGQIVKGQRNYCRNPNRRRYGPWCYIDKWGIEPTWEYCDVPMCGTRITTFGGNIRDHTRCYFPFIFRNKRYFRCIKTRKINKRKGRWCGVTHNYDEHKQWGYCNMKVETHGGNVPPSGVSFCTFPFIFKGVRYMDCIKTSNYLMMNLGMNPQPGRKWCGLSSNVDVQPYWAYCGPGVKLELGRPVRCAIPYRYRGEHFFHCTTRNSSRPWCSLTNNFDSHRRRVYCPNEDCIWEICYGNNIMADHKQTLSSTKRKVL